VAWYRRTRRDLPWRRTRDPYRVLVSEFMLQQTQVSRVTEYYPRFLERFGSIEVLARARPKAVREAWDGLGYYARARNLHRVARQVSGAGGQVPDDPRELVKLPGIGRYTAGAVACFRRVFFGERVAGNGKRPLRISDCGLRNGKAGSKQVWETAARLVPREGKRAWRFNQAIMELGATVCTARKPKCPQCPVLGECRTGRFLIARD
jgi:A/G-specific adenine glycosylase